MARIIYIVCFIFFMAGLYGNAQADSVVYLSQHQFIQGSFTNFYVDNLNNIYLLNTDNQIKKLNDKGDSIAVANALKRFGDIYSMDVSNALKIAVYYKDFTTIIVLDRFLKNVNTIDLRRHGILQAKAVAISYDNNYWVFDEVENKLKKIDDNGNFLLSTPDLRLVFNESFSPEQIIDYDGYVYLFNKDKGCKIFDYYGTLKQSVATVNFNNFQVMKNSIVGIDDSVVHVYNIAIFKENSYLLNPQMNGAFKLHKTANGVYALKPDGLHVYSIGNY